MDTKTYKFDLSEEEIRMIAIYRKGMLDDECSISNKINSIKDAQEFVDRFKLLIESEKIMETNSNMIYSYLYRILCLFHERCNFYGQSSHEHIGLILDSVTQGKELTDEPKRPSLN